MGKKYKVVKYYKGKMMNIVSEHETEGKANQVCSVMNSEIKKIVGDSVSFKVQCDG